jgi:hypothetical protein
MVEAKLQMEQPIVKRFGGVRYVCPLRRSSMAGVIVEEPLCKQKVVVKRMKTAAISFSKCILIVI